MKEKKTFLNDNYNNDFRIEQVEKIKKISDEISNIDVDEAYDRVCELINISKDGNINTEIPNTDLQNYLEVFSSKMLSLLMVMGVIEKPEGINDIKRIASIRAATIGLLGGTIVTLEKKGFISIKKKNL